MRIRVEFPNDGNKTDAQPFCESIKNNQLTEEEQKIRDLAVSSLGAIMEIGYKYKNSKLVAIEKKEGYLIVNIDERVASVIENQGR